MVITEILIKTIRKHFSTIIHKVTWHYGCFQCEKEVRQAFSYGSINWCICVKKYTKKDKGWKNCSNPLIQFYSSNPGSRNTSFKIYYIATIIKTLWYQHKDRYIDQLNRRESSEINPCIHAQASKGQKGPKTIQWEKNTLFSNGVGKTRYPNAKSTYHTLLHKN